MKLGARGPRGGSAGLRSKPAVRVPPTWERLPEALAVCAHRPNLGRTVGIALVVGTLLVGINQSGPLLRGDVAPVLVARILLDYLVPFIVSNLGVLSGSRRPGGPGGRRFP